MCLVIGINDILLYKAPQAKNFRSKCDCAKIIQYPCTKNNNILANQHFIVGNSDDITDVTQSV